MNKRLTPTHARVRQAGFTLIELMVAMSIGLIIMLGMTVTFVNLKNTFQTQDKMAQLQDGERLALSMLTTSLNEAGYYPDPRNPSPIVASPAPAATPGGAMAVGTYVFGTASAGAVPESLSTTYASINGDGLMSCLGTTNPTAGTTVTVRNIFYVDSTKGSLMCKVMVDGATSNAMAHGGTAEELISGVNSMSIIYGIAPSGGTQITTYKSPGNVTAAEWAGSVKAVRVTLNFANPFSSAASDVVRTHTINLMN